MPRRILLALTMAATVLVMVPFTAFLEDAPRFRLGFETLAGLIPDVVGAPLEDEHHNALNGDGLQMTTRGLMVWRKADNWTAFTNGWWTWVNGPYGLQDRANYARFEWEADASQAEEVIPVADAASGLAGAAGAASEELSPTATPGLALLISVATATPYVEPVATAFPSSSPTETPAPTSTLIPSATPVPTATRVPTIAPSRTPVPTRTPTATRQPTATRTPTPIPTATATATSRPSGVKSPDPAGNWVTSTASSTRYYCSADSTYWKTWSASNRIWFATESDLLTAYPGRTRHD